MPLDASTSIAISNNTQRGYLLDALHIYGHEIPNKMFMNFMVFIF